MNKGLQTIIIRCFFLKTQIKHMAKYLLPFLISCAFFYGKAQNNLQISVSNTTLAASDSILPFWFTANNNGKIQTSVSFLNLSEISAGQDYNKEAKSKLTYTWGSHLVAGLGETSYLQLNRLFAGLSFKGWEIKGGTFYDEIRFAGLSTTNGNLARSQNPRPVPKIRLSTMGYKFLPFFQNWFSFKFEYDEGFLNDDRYVHSAHLHHKSLYGKFQTGSSWNIHLGFEHFAMWGGTSKNDKIGKLPDDWNAYWHYVFALPGNEDFPGTDQKNISGNQLGTYQLEIVKDFTNITSAFYLSHPWEDNSGLNWRNWPDNLLGIHLHLKNEKKLITDFVYEFTNTRQQSILDSIYSWDENSGKWKMNEYDNYYNHGIYQSGFTFEQQVMSSPLFYPVILQEGISMGIRSNRYFSHHIGVKGNLSEYLFWKGMLTYVQHLGTYSKPFLTNQKQISGLFDVQYLNPEFPVELGLSLGADTSNSNFRNVGVRFSVSKSW